MSRHKDILVGPNPQLIAFDCDYTLYNYDCDKERIAPFTRYPYWVSDWYGRRADSFPDVPEIVGAIVDAGIPVAYLSRNPSAGPLEALLRTLPLISSRLHEGSLWDAMPKREYFHAYGREGFGKGKDRHFAALYRVAHVEPSQILFFDDLSENVTAAAEKGVTSILLGKSGLNWQAFSAGVTAWRKKIEAAAPSGETYTEEHGQPQRRPQEEGRQGEGEAGA